MIYRFCTRSPAKRLKKNAVKNVWDGVTTALEFNLTANYFYLNSFTSFFKIVLFIWLNTLVPGVSNLYPQYLSFTMQPFPDVL